MEDQCEKFSEGIVWWEAFGAKHPDLLETSDLEAAMGEQIGDGGLLENTKAVESPSPQAQGSLAFVFASDAAYWPGVLLRY